jgi:hypothetical protein
MSQMEGSTNRSGKETARSWFIIQGAVANTLVEWAGDGALVIPNILRMLGKSLQLFQDGSHGAQNVATKILNNPTLAMIPLEHEVKMILKSQTRCLDNLYNAHTVLWKALECIQKRQRPESNTSKRKASHDGNQGGSKRPRILGVDSLEVGSQVVDIASLLSLEMPFSPQEIASILGSSKILYLAPLSLILTEALRAKLWPHSQPIFPALREVVTGTLRETHPDHRIALRFSNQNAQAVKRIFANDSITTPIGISNLLAYIRLGSGSETAAFVNAMEVHEWRRVVECYERGRKSRTKYNRSTCVGNILQSLQHEE